MVAFNKYVDKMDRSLAISGTLFGQHVGSSI
jgi:hypothetical protein